MCFHSALTTETTSLKHRYKASNSVEFQGKKHVNVFEKAVLPIVVQQLDGRELRSAEWGLIPTWASFLEAEKLQMQTPNARIETVLEKPSFRDAIVSHRCLVPATGFFEWRHQGEKFPFFIQMKGQEIFSFAGIWSQWQHPSGEIKTTFSILTTEANQTMAYIHNSKLRMPVILQEKDEDRWLQKGHQELDYFKKPLPDSMITSVSIKFNADQTDFKTHQHAALSQQQLGLF